VVDGKPSPAYDEVSNPIFSPDGQHVAYMATQGDNQFVVVDGKPGPTYFDIRSLAFSPDSLHLAYEAKMIDKWLLIVDGVASTTVYDNNLQENKIVFSNTSTLNTIVQRDRTYFRVELTITETK